MRVKSRILPFQLVAKSLKKFLDDDCLNLSSSISFVFILSIIPFAMLNIFIFNVIQRAAFPDIALTEYLGGVLAREMVRFIPLITEEWVKTYIVFPTNSFTSFRIINFILLPIVSGLLFKTLETSYRKIFKLPNRHLLFSQALYAVMTIFIALLFFISSFLWNIISTALAHAINLINKTEYYGRIDTLLNSNPFLSKISFFSVLLIIVFYFLTVKIFLNIKIKIPYIFLSGCTFCLLWVIAREIFQLYVEHVSKVNLIYGSLSSIVIILLWIFYSSLALLYSVELLYFLHTKNL